MTGKSKVDDQYDSLDDGDDDDDDALMPGLRAKSPQGRQLVQVQVDNFARWPLPSRLWPYEYVVEDWAAMLRSRGIGERRIKAFFTEEYIVNGSEFGGVDTHWSNGQELWEAEIAATGQKRIFFSGHAIDELVNILSEQCTQTTKSAIKPNIDRSLVVQNHIEPGSLRTYRPTDVEELRKIMKDIKTAVYSLDLVQGRHCYDNMVNRGGTAITLKTQRYEAEDRIMLDIGWSYVRYKRTSDGGVVKMDCSQHFINCDALAYRNRLKLPDNRKCFGFGASETLQEVKIWKRFEKFLDGLCQLGPVIFVMHHASLEIDYMKRFEINTAGWQRSFPQELFYRNKDTGLFPIVIQDTQRLFAAHVKDPAMTNASLLKACERIRIQNLRKDKMHNAGNDAYYMLQLFHELMR